VGDGGVGRSQEFHRDLLYLAYKQISNLAKTEKDLGGSRKLVTDNQRVFGSVYQKSVNSGTGNLLMGTPAWFKQVAPLFRIVDVGKDYPDTSEYLLNSPSKSVAARLIRQEIAGLTSARRETNAKLQGKHSNPEIIEKQVAKLSEEIDQLKAKSIKLFDSMTDCNLLAVQSLKNSVKLEVGITNPIIDSFAKFANGLGEVITQIVNKQNVENKDLPWFDISIDGSGKVSCKSSSLLLKNTQGSENGTTLSTLIEAHCDLRETLLHFFSYLQTRTEDTSTASVIPTLRSELQSVFPKQPDSGRGVILQLNSLADPELASVVARLLLSRRLPARDAAYSEPIFLLKETESLELVQVLADLLITKSFEFPPDVKAGLMSGEMDVVFKECDKARKCLEGKEYESFATILDKELIRRTDKKSSTSLGDNLAFLAVLTTLARSPNHSRFIKPHLKHQDLVPVFCSALLGQERSLSSNLRGMIDESRKIIGKNLAVTLRDYIGQTKIKEYVLRTFNSNIRILSKLSLYPGVQPKLALFNGFLFYGAPGAGKSFLVKCLSNELGIPLINISAEELDKVGLSKSQERNQTIDEFLAEKARTATHQMEMTGAQAAIIFIDEMEALFLKRDPSFSSRSELDETNRMLRVLEQVMEKHPAIFFVAATNNISIVDPAALRKGRFGTHIELKAASQDDALALIEDACSVLDTSFEGLKTDPQFTTLLNECTGMMPYPIQNTIVHSFIAHDLRPGDPASSSTLIDAIKEMKEHSGKIE
jgi:AAA+ superfamily predicted ATPase